MMNDNVYLSLTKRVSALELAVFALCKTAADKDGLILDIQRLMGRLQPAEPDQSKHFDEIKALLEQYRKYAEIGKYVKPGQ